jgi:hypothetical protein
MAAKIGSGENNINGISGGVIISVSRHRRIESNVGNGGIEEVISKMASAKMAKNSVMAAKIKSAKITA